MLILCVRGHNHVSTGSTPTMSCQLMLKGPFSIFTHRKNDNDNDKINLNFQKQKSNFSKIRKHKTKLQVKTNRIVKKIQQLNNINFLSTNQEKNTQTFSLSALRSPFAIKRAPSFLPSGPSRANESERKRQMHTLVECAQERTHRE